MSTSHRVSLPLMSNAIVQNVVGSVLDDDRQHTSFTLGSCGSSWNSHGNYSGLLSQNIWQQESKENSDPVRVRPNRDRTLYNCQEYPPGYYPYPTNFPSSVHGSGQWFQQTKQPVQPPVEDADNALRLAMALLRLQGNGSFPSTPSSCSSDSGRFSFTPPPPQDLDFYRNVPPPTFAAPDRALSVAETMPGLERPESAPPVGRDGRFTSFSPGIWEQGREEADRLVVTSRGLKLYPVSDVINAEKLISECKKNQQTISLLPPPATSRQEVSSLILLCTSRMDEVEHMCLRISDVLGECRTGKPLYLPHVSRTRTSVSGGRTGIDAVVCEAETLHLSIVAFLGEVETCLYQGVSAAPAKHTVATKKLFEAINELKKERLLEKQRNSRTKKKQPDSDDAGHQYTQCLEDLLKSMDSILSVATLYYEDVCFSLALLRDLNLLQIEDETADLTEAQTTWDASPATAQTAW